jgi:hypothetical protein
MLLGDNSGIMISERRGGKPKLMPHKELETYLGRYSGLILYVKETEEGLYSRICGVRVNIWTKSKPAHSLFRLIFLLPVIFTVNK